MQFFCAQCQKKHDVGDISADMFSIGAAGIVDGIKITAAKLKEQFPDKKDAFDALQVELTKFINFYINNKSGEGLVHLENVKLPGGNPIRYSGDIRFNAFFALQGSTIQKSGEIAPGTGITNINYRYQVTLEQIYDLYMLCQMQKDRAALEIFANHSIRQHLGNIIVWAKDLRCEFDEHAKYTLYRVFPDNKYDTQGVVRICPHCGRELSYASGMGEEIVVALAGAPRAGKTSCMVALLNTLYSNNLANVSLQLDGNDKKWRSLLKEISLYRMGVRVEKTPDKITEVPSFSFKLKVGNSPVKVLTIVDMPGEFWVRDRGTGINKEFFDNYAGLYENIDCVWFAISKATIKLYRMDSMEMEKYRKKLIDEFNENLEQIEIADPHILQQNLHSLATYLSGRGKEMPPFLVMVSKPDFFISSADVTETCTTHQLYPMVGKDPAAYSYQQVRDSVAQANVTEQASVTGQNPTCLREMDMWKHARNVRRYIQQVNEAFLKAIEDNCPKRFYISLSAYGWAAVDPEKYSSYLRATDAERYKTFAKLIGEREAPQAAAPAKSADPFGTPAADPFGFQPAPAADPFGFQPAAPTAAPAAQTAAVESVQPQPPVPFHETYPLLWTLAVNGALPVCHRVVLNKKFMGRVVEDVSKDKCYLFDGNEDPAENPEAESICRSIRQNLLLFKAGKDLTFSKTTFEEGMTLHELLVHKRDH